MFLRPRLKGYSDGARFPCQSVEPTFGKGGGVQESEVI